MSIDVTSYDSNITYLNLHQIGVADREDTPCIANIDYPSPLLGRIDGYVCTVNRFVIPTHTLFLNDRMKTAIVLYTNDRTLLMATGGPDMGGDVEIMSLDIQYLSDEYSFAMSARQTAYFQAEHAKQIADQGLPSVHIGEQHHMFWQETIRDDMAGDNVAFFNNRDDDQHPFQFTFDYTQCHTLYEVSELLETWCKSVTAKFRNQGTYTWVPAHQGEEAYLALSHPVPNRPRLYDRDGEELSNEDYATFLLRIFIAPDYTLRVLCSAPQFLGCFFGKGFRNVFKLPRFLDYDIQTKHGESPDDFRHAVMPMPSRPFYFDPDLNSEQHEAIVANQAIPFTPRLSFQDTYHRVQGFTLTSDLPSVGELSIENAYFRILSDFRYTPSSGTIESSASKNDFLSTDTNFISEAPPGNVEYFAANGTTGRLILLRGAYPLYRMTIQVMTDVLIQNPYERLETGYIKFREDILHVMPSREQLTLAPNARFTCKIAFISRQKHKTIHPPGSH